MQEGIIRATLAPWRLLNHIVFTAGCRSGFRLGLKWSDTTKLQARLERDCCLSHWIIAELASRGEPVEQFRDYVESLLRSNSFIRRSCGKMIRRKWFPDMKP